MALVKTAEIVSERQIAASPLTRTAPVRPVASRYETEGDQSSRRGTPHAVIIVENMTVPPDRRVWQQACALRDEGWRVTVITPQVGSIRTPREILEGVEIIRHPLLIEARNTATYAIEYANALVCETLALAGLNLRNVDVVQICNPPDFLFAPALLAKTVGGAKVVFDHHDLTPELLAQKLGVNRGPLMAFARWAEAMTFKVADRVISTNSSFRQHALDRGGKAAQDVTTVYSSPDLDRLREGRIRPALKQGRDVMLLWVGVIGSQDGVDALLEAVRQLRGLPGGDRFHLTIAGDGPERAALEAQAAVLGLSGIVRFAGFLTGDDLADVFATADIGVGSDPKNPFNDRLAMNKVMEYMAYGLPSAMFDLSECRKIAGDSALYAANNDPAALAAHLSNLIEAPCLRAAMGERGRKRLEARYCWSRQRERYLDVYRSLLAEA